MASEGSGDASVSVTLPESLRRWLDDKAEEDGRSREDLLLQLVSAYRKVEGLEEGEVVLSDDDGVDTLAERRTEVETAVEQRVQEAVEQRVDEAVEQRVEERIEEVVREAVEERIEAEVQRQIEEGVVDTGSDDEDLSALESRFMELLRDVRERVVQVKRETDAKAPADHDHPALAGVDELEALEGELRSLERGLEGLEERFDAGFDNYESVLEYLADAVETAVDRQTRLAKALVETRDELRSLAARDAARSAAEDLKREAGRHGVRKAVCDDCGNGVAVGLLTRANCPHCSAAFVGVEPSARFFGKHTLATGDRPALTAAESAGDGFEHGVADMLEDDHDRPDVDIDGDGDVDADADGPDGGSADGGEEP